LAADAIAEEERVKKLKHDQDE